MGPGRRRRYFYGRTRAEAAAKLRDAIRERDLGIKRAPADLRVGPWLERWLRDQEEGGRRPKTLRFNRQVVELHIAPELGRIRLVDLSVQDVQRLLARKAKEVSPSRADDVRAVLRAALNHAMRRELLVRNVAALADPIAVERKEAAFWRAAEARVFLEAIRDHPRAALYLSMIGMALRPSEALAIRLEDVDLEGKVLQVRVQVQYAKTGAALVPVKTRGSRAPVPLPDLVAEALREHVIQLLRAGQNQWGLLFVDRRGRPLSLDWVRREFHQLVEGAGLPRIKLYDATRHTAASLLAAAGVHPRTAQRILRHVSVETTMRIYTHVAPEMEWAAADAIDRALRR